MKSILVPLFLSIPFSLIGCQKKEVDIHAAAESKTIENKEDKSHKVELRIIGLNDIVIIGETRAIETCVLDLSVKNNSSVAYKIPLMSYVIKKDGKAEHIINPRASDGTSELAKKSQGNFLGGYFNSRDLHERLMIVKNNNELSDLSCKDIETVVFLTSEGIELDLGLGVTKVQLQGSQIEIKTKADNQLANDEKSEIAKLAASTILNNKSRLSEQKSDPAFNDLDVLSNCVGIYNAIHSVAKGGNDVKEYNLSLAIKESFTIAAYQVGANDGKDRKEVELLLEKREWRYSSLAALMIQKHQESEAQFRAMKNVCIRIMNNDDKFKNIFKAVVEEKNRGR